MKNREKYADKIKNYKGDDFCHDFVRTIVLNKINCEEIRCTYCQSLQMLWLDEEYEEPEVDWSKVPVDTLIRVRFYKSDDWINRYFSKYENGKVYAWDNGTTSKTGKSDSPWLCAEIVNEDTK